MTHSMLANKRSKMFDSQLVKVFIKNVVHHACLMPKRCRLLELFGMIFECKQFKF